MDHGPLQISLLDKMSDRKGPTFKGIASDRKDPTYTRHRAAGDD
jgi:hypothetical protein